MTLYCAICRRRFEKDSNHVRVRADKKPPDGRPTVTNYVFCGDCWRFLVDGLGDPV